MNDTLCECFTNKLYSNKPLTYKQACIDHGLAFDNIQWIDGLEESILSTMLSVIRLFFVKSLVSRHLGELNHNGMCLIDLFNSCNLTVGESWF